MWKGECVGGHVICFTAPLSSSVLSLVIFSSEAISSCFIAIFLFNASQLPLIPLSLSLHHFYINIAIKY